MNAIKKDKKKLVKAISTEIIICVVIAAVIGLMLLFDIIDGSDLLGKIMLTLLTLFISGLFFLNSVNAIVKGNKLGLASAIAIMVCAILYILLIWAEDVLGQVEVYTYFVVILSMLSIFMNLVISNYIVLGNNLIAIQVVLYIAFGYIETTLAFVILGNSVLIDIWQVFVAAIIVAVTLYVILKVKQKNIQNTAATANGEYVTITKEEYDRLKAAEERLKELEQGTTAAVPPVLGVNDVSGTPADENELR